MTWLTWRLHRNEAALGVLLFAGLVATLFFGIRSVDMAYDAARESGCFGSENSLLCSEKLTEYYDRTSFWDRLTPVLHGIPIAIAALVVIPTLHELERGTHRLAWTQSISRRRWTLIRFGFVIAVAALVAAIWALTAWRWRAGILDSTTKSFGQNAFELSPAVLIGYTLFALALVLAAGVVVRRLVPSLALLVVAFVGTRMFTTFVLRERYRDPEEQTFSDFSTAYGSDQRRSWIVDESWLNRSGDRVSWDAVNQLCSLGDQQTETAYQQCLADNGLTYFLAYHPIDRFFQFQAIETLIFSGLATGSIIFAYWWLTRRSA